MPWLSTLATTRPTRFVQLLRYVIHQVSLFLLLTLRTVNLEWLWKDDMDPPLPYLYYPNKVAPPPAFRSLTASPIKEPKIKEGSLFIHLLQWRALIQYIERLHSSPPSSILDAHPSILAGLGLPNLPLKHGQSPYLLCRSVKELTGLIESDYEPPDILTQRPTAGTLGRSESPLVDVDKLKVFLNESA